MISRYKNTRFILNCIKTWNLKKLSYYGTYQYLAIFEHDDNTLHIQWNHLRGYHLFLNDQMIPAFDMPIHWKILKLTKQKEQEKVRKVLENASSS